MWNKFIKGMTLHYFRTLNRCLQVRIRSEHFVPLSCTFAYLEWHTICKGRRPSSIASSNSARKPAQSNPKWSCPSHPTNISLISSAKNLETWNLLRKMAQLKRSRLIPFAFSWLVCRKEWLRVNFECCFRSVVTRSSRLWVQALGSSPSGLQRKPNQV